MTELTKDDIRNGWTAEALERYHAERQAAADQRISEQMERRPRPEVANHRYNPLRWRG